MTEQKSRRSSNKSATSSGNSPAITGKYQMVKSDNFDEYMKALGVGFVLRKLGNTSSPVTEISKNGEDWNIKTSTTFKTTDIKFKLGQEFQEETADGRQCKSVIKKNGNDTLVHQQECGAAGKSEIVRKFAGNEMTMTLKKGDVTATRVYKKVE